MIRSFLIILACFAFLTNCSSNNGVEMPEPVEMAEIGEPVETLYKEAQASLDDGLYKTAAKQFDEIERDYPYSVWAKRAMLMSAFSYYQNEDYDRAIISLERFIQLHPADERIDYAYYLKAMCYYEQISDVRRDQKMTELALNHLLTVIKRFPESGYAKDARLKIDLTFDHLAGREMEIGRYYLNKKVYNAAIRRFQKVIQEYQTTTHVAEALYRLVEANLAIGLEQEAKKSAAVLGHNYPGSDWYEDAYKLINHGEIDNQNGFFGKAWDSIIN